jgi:hypothetical protein
MQGMTKDPKTQQIEGAFETFVEALPEDLTGLDLLSLVTAILGTFSFDDEMVRGFAGHLITAANNGHMARSAGLEAAA